MNKARAGKDLLLAAEIIFICVAFVFISWMQSLVNSDLEIEFSFAQLTNWWNWMVIIAQALLCVFIINAIIDYGYNEKKTRVTSRLCRILKTNELRVDKIYELKLTDKLDEAIKRTNDAARQECYVRHLRKINARIEWDDVSHILRSKDTAQDTDHAVDIEQARAELIRRYCISEKQKRKFARILDRAIEGKYKDYETITSFDMLNKGLIESTEKRSLKDKRYKVRGGLLGKNIISFILFSSALSIVISEMIMDFSMVGTVANIIYIVSAAFKGIAAMTYYCNYTEALFDRRNSLLAKELDLKEEWDVSDRYEKAN